MGPYHGKHRALIYVVNKILRGHEKGYGHFLVPYKLVCKNAVKLKFVDLKMLRIILKKDGCYFCIFIHLSTNFMISISLMSE